MLTPLTPAQRTELETAVARYQSSVDTVAGYLAGRGITQEVAEAFRLGCVTDPVPGDEGVRGRLAIPFLTPAGPVQIRFRSLDPNAEAKYLPRPGNSPTLYNVGALRTSSDVLVLCEGELDAITMHALVGVPAVGVPGVTAWEPFWARLFVDFERVIIPTDGDDAGRGFGKSLAKQMGNVAVIELPSGQDVNSLYLAEGADALRARLGI